MKMKLVIREEYEKVLKSINESYYNHKTLGKVIEDMIEDHLLRENGRLGIMKKGKYIDF